jgi:serpin B
MKRLLLGSAALIALALSAPAADQPAQPKQPNTRPVVAGNTQFAVDLFHQLRTQEGNLFYSPFSISTALAMTSAGARGQTLEQMTRALHLPPQDDLHPAMAAILQQANVRGRKRAYTLRTVNALWAQKGRPFRAEFLDLNRAHYKAGVKQVDFRNDTEKARRTINAWVEKQTNGKIKRLLVRGKLKKTTSLVLTNTIYFKGAWGAPFEKALTRIDDFHVSPKDKVRVPLMHQQQDFPYAEDRNAQVLSLPYKGNALDMVIVLPRRVDGLAEVEKGLTTAQLSTWLKALRRRPVEVTLPRFKITQGHDLKDHLKALGMTDAFNENTANFTGLTSKSYPWFLAAVVHKAFVAVDEKGTEAAAATAVVGEDTDEEGPGPAIVKFRADHPFLFLIRDWRQDSILFVGRVARP